MDDQLENAQTVYTSFDADERLILDKESEIVEGLVSEMGGIDGLTIDRLHAAFQEAGLEAF